MIKKIVQYFSRPKNEKLKQAFDNVLKRAYHSPTFYELTQKTQRVTFKLFNIMNLDQFNLMVDLILENEQEHFIDIGCGFGMLTQALATKTGKQGFGFDLSSEAIKIANTIKKDHYFVADFNQFDAELPNTSLFVSVDGLYLVKDYKKLFTRLREISKGPGKLIMLRTEVTRRSDLFVYLKKSDLHYKITDLTQHEIDYWNLIAENLEDYKEGFIKEDNEILYTIKKKELEKHLDFINRKLLKRFIIEISWDN